MIVWSNYRPVDDNYLFGVIVNCVKRFSCCRCIFWATQISLMKIMIYQHYANVLFDSDVLLHNKNGLCALARRFGFAFMHSHIIRLQLFLKIQPVIRKACNVLNHMQATHVTSRNRTN